jgi:hypothetical protein
MVLETNINSILTAVTEQSKLAAASLSSSNVSSSSVLPPSSYGSR